MHVDTLHNLAWQLPVLPNGLSEMRGTGYGG